MLMSDETVLDAATHLAENDPALKPVIEQIGPCPLRPHTSYYQELVESILGQQLSLQAAAAIEARFIALFEGTFPSPEQILSVDIETLRGIGFSRAKAAYVQDLALHVLDGSVVLDKFDDFTNEEIITELTVVKGIGEWTVHMFLIFCMGRSDVLPVGDLGIKNGIRKLYGLQSQTTPDDITRIAAQNHWHPYESVASWYVWQSLKLPD
jgi:DNA-3-methyladenine glycosylase II